MHEKIEWKELSGLCRLCLSDKCPLQDVFDPITDNHKQISSLIDKILDSTSIKIIQTDELPTKVCYKCSAQVEKMYKFKQNCLAAESLLKKHVKHKLQLKELQSQAVGKDSTSQNTYEERGEGAASSSGTLAMYPCDSRQGDFVLDIVKVEIKEEEGSMTEDVSSSSDGEGGNISKTQKGKTMLPKVTKYCCKQCGKSFCHKYSLRRHEWSHLKKTLSCEHCGKIFTNQESFVRHEKMHRVGNRYQCPMCDKSYVSSASHAAHVRKHTGERPFKCSDCDETFYLLSSFERHMAKHRGVKDYTCEICDADFWVADDLRAHVNRKH